jgi:hypothetical protein
MRHKRFPFPYRKGRPPLPAQGTQPILVALARGLKTRIEPELKEALSENRLLMITPFGGEVKWVTAETAKTRNAMMIDLADEIVIGYASKGGMLERLP